MRLRIIAVAAIVAVLGVVAATASAGTSRQQANKLTVWLQVDAQSGWPDLVAAANQQFQSDHPGWSVDVQYQNWGDHLQKFDATIAGNTSPDVIEMGNTEMVKYMAAGAFADISSFKSNFANSANWLAGLAKSGQYGGKTYGVPYYAGSRVVTYRTDLYKKAGITQDADEPEPVHRRRRQARVVEREGEGLLAGLQRRHRLVLRDGVRLRLRRHDREDEERQVGRRPRLEAVDRGPDRLEGVLERDVEGEPDLRREQPGALHRVLAGNRRVDHRPGLVQLLRRQRSTRRPRRSS